MTGSNPGWSNVPTRRISGADGLNIWNRINATSSSNYWLMTTSSAGDTLRRKTFQVQYDEEELGPQRRWLVERHIDVLGSDEPMVLFARRVGKLVSNENIPGCSCVDCKSFYVFLDKEFRCNHRGAELLEDPWAKVCADFKRSE